MRYVSNKAFGDFKFISVNSNRKMVVEYNKKIYTDVTDVFNDFGVTTFKGIGHQAVYSPTFLPSLLFDEYKNSFVDKLKPYVPEYYDVYFQTSGTECMELSLKIAAHEVGKNMNVAIFKNDFHGRTIASLTASSVPDYYRPPIDACITIHEYEFTKFDIERIIEDKSINVVIGDTLGQGDGNLEMRDLSLWAELKKNRPDIILILDETQLYMRVPHYLFAWQSSLYKTFSPDIFFTAKGIANGIPLGAVFMNNRYSKHIQNGKHHSTFGGTPLAMSIASMILERWSETVPYKEYVPHPFKGYPHLFVLSDIENKNYVEDMLRCGWLVSPLRINKGICKFAPPLDLKDWEYLKLMDDALENMG